MLTIIKMLLSQSQISTELKFHCAHFCSFEKKIGLQITTISCCSPLWSLFRSCLRDFLEFRLKESIVIVSSRGWREGKKTTFRPLGFLRSELKPEEAQWTSWSNLSLHRAVGVILHSVLTSSLHCFFLFFFFFFTELARLQSKDVAICRWCSYSHLAGLGVFIRVAHRKRRTEEWRERMRRKEVKKEAA